MLVETAHLTKYDTPEVTYINGGANAGHLCMFFIILCVYRSVVGDSFEPMHAGSCVEGQDTLQGKLYHVTYCIIVIIVSPLQARYLPSHDVT